MLIYYSNLSLFVTSKVIEINTLKIFGNTIRFYRSELRISQEKLAEKCGFHRTYIGQIERGERNPSLKNIIIISKSLNISLSELFKTFEKLKTPLKFEK